MCGICGFAGFHDEHLLRRMTEVIRHRGPDGEGLYSSDQPVGLGMRRLAIIDLSTGDQPILNEDGSIVVVYNGEIYNFAELRDDLARKGHRFVTKTDTEAIVHAYEEYGDECVRHFRGMFAFALWDIRRKRLFIARDHVGIKPLFYAQLDDRLLFGSEIKSLLQCPDLEREMDYSALNHYLSFLYVPAPRTIYKAVRKLPAGHTLVWENGKMTISPYWAVPEYTPGPRRDERYYLEGIDHLLRASVSEQKIADVPLGAFLSGGFDSSAVVSYLSEVSPVPAKTFTIGYGPGDPSYDETRKARIIADAFHCDHHEYIVRPNAMELMEQLVRHFDEPFADSSAIPTFLISRETRREVTVALTGIGGDELFGGYPRHLGARLSVYYSHLPSPVRSAIHAASLRLPESTKSRNLGGWIKRFARGGIVDFRTRYLTWMLYLTERDRAALYSDDFKSHLGCATAIDGSLYGSLRSPQDIFQEEIRNYLADDLLCLADRMSMANSLELRVPFLDTRLIEFARTIPLEMKTRGFTLKYLIKKLMADKLPAEILRQRKMGFQIPIGRWINEEMRPMIADLLSPRRISQAGLFNPVEIARILDQHRRGERTFTDQIFSLLMFQLWDEQAKRAVSDAPRYVPALEASRDGRKEITIAVLTDIIPRDEHGGSGRVAWELSVNLRKRGHRVLVITRGVKGSPPRETIDGIEVFRYYSNPFRFLTILKRILSEHRVDVFNFHHPYTSYLALQTCRRRRIPALYIFHSPWHREYEIRSRDLRRNPVHNWCGSLVRRIMERRVLSACGKIVAASAFMSDELSKTHALPHAIAPLGVDTERFIPFPDRAALRERLNIPADRFVLFTVRNLVSRMGLENLVDAMKKVVAAHPEVFLVIGGKGYLKQRLEEMIRAAKLENHVRLEGYIDDSLLPAYYQCADVFVLPTRSLEGFGLVTVEALSCGTPVLATPVAANREVVGKFDPSLLFASHDADAIAGGIIAFIPRYLREKDQLRARCRTYIENTYSWNRFTDTIETMFHSLSRRS